MAPDHDLSRRDLLRGAAVLGGAAVVTSIGVGAARGATKPTATPIIANDLGSIGDSISHNGVGRGISGETGRGMAIFGPQSFIGSALLQAQGTFRFSGTWATGGYTTRRIRYNHLPAALKSGASLVSVIGGTNDIRQHVDVTETQTNLTSIVTQLLDNGQRPILGTIPPYNPGTPVQLAQVSAYNAWLRSFAAANDLPIVDYHSVLVDPATGLYIEGYDVDGIHPNGTGAHVMGTALAATLATLAGGVAPTLLSAYTPTALLKDPTFVGPPDGVAPTWSVTGSTVSGGTHAEVTGPLWEGNLGLVTRGSGSDYYFIGTVGTLIPGHVVSLSFILDTPNLPAGGTWTVELLDATSRRVVCGYNAIDTAYSDGISTWQFTVPSECSPRHRYEFAFSAQKVAGTQVGCAQVTVQDLTAMGLDVTRQKAVSSTH